MTSMVEHVARAIRDERLKWKWTEPGMKVMALDEVLARAAIAAMREPTIEMSIAAFGDGSIEFDPAVVWRAIIAAALAEKP